MRSKLFILTAVTIATLAVPTIGARAQVFGDTLVPLEQWIMKGTGAVRMIRPVSTSTIVVIGANSTSTNSKLQTPSLTVTGLGGGGTLCVHVDNNGTLSTAAADCGTGGSGTSTITINGIATSSFSFLAAGTGLSVASSGNAITYTIASSSYLQPGNNLSELTSTSTARSNLGLGTAATQNSTAFLQVANNGSDISSTSTFRTNLGLTDTATQPSSTWLKVANNLSDLNNSSTARTNLGVKATSSIPVADANGIQTSYGGSSCSATGLVNIVSATGTVTCLSTSTVFTNLGLADTSKLASSTWLKVSNNGSDINSTSSFRSNLGLTDTAIQASSTWLKVANNGSDINNTSTFRTNLGLTDTATTASSSFMKTANNGSDAASTSTFRTNIGLGLYPTSTSPTNNAVIVGTGSGYVFSTLPDCTSAQTPHYNTSTRAWSCQADAGGASSTAKLPNIVVAATGGDYTTIGAAITAANNKTNFPEGARIWLTDLSYTDASSTGHVIENSNIFIQGNFGGSVINWQAGSATAKLFSASSSLAVPVTNLTLRDLILSQTSSTYAGYAIDASNVEVFRAQNIKSSGFNRFGNINDTQNLSFYQHWQDIESYDDNCIIASSTNPFNDNKFESVRCAPNQSNTTSTKWSFFLNNGQNNHLDFFNAEPAFATGTIGIELRTSNVINTLITGLYAEANQTSTLIGSGVSRTSIIGGMECCHNSNGLVDNGTDTVVLNFDNDFGTPTNKIGTTGLDVVGGVRANTLNVTSTVSLQGQTASRLLATDSSKNVTSTAVSSKLSLSGGTLDVASKISSSSVTFNFYDATSTAPYKFANARFSTDVTLSKVTCAENASGATVTIQLFRSTNPATSTVDTNLLSSIACSPTATSTTTFASSTLTAGTWLVANVTSTAGTPTWTAIGVDYKKN